MLNFSSFILGSHIFMNVSNLFLCLGNEIGFKFICHKYGMYSLIFSCGESFLCCRVTYTAAVIKMFVWFSLLCCLPVLKHLLLQPLSQRPLRMVRLVCIVFWGCLGVCGGFVAVFQDSGKQNSGKLEKYLQESRRNYQGQFCLLRVGLQWISSRILIWISSPNFKGFMRYLGNVFIVKRLQNLP